MKTLRTLTIRQTAGELRTAIFEDREHLVVPVIMVQEGVLHAVNAAAPEFVPAEELSQFAAAWGDSPVLWDHPEVDGVRVSATSPEVLERFRFGRVFNVRMQGAKLRGDVWIDLALAAAMGGEAQAVVDRINAGEMLEVSVGAFVVAEDTPGIWNGIRFAAIWREIVPDHLAVLPAGKIGACSNEMGCGLPRAAEATPGTYVRLADSGRALLRDSGGVLIAAATDDPEGEESMKPKTLRERFGDAVKFIFRSNQGELSDSELRQILEAALFSTEPAFVGVEDVFSGEEIVVYATFADDTIQWFSRSYSVAEDGEVTFGESTEVRPVTRFEPVNAEAAEPCGCSDPAAPSGDATGDTAMREEKIAALIANEKTPYGEADTKALEALSDETFEKLVAASEAPVAEPVVEPKPEPVAPVAEPEKKKDDEDDEPVVAQTVEEFLSTAPPEIVEMWKERQAEKAERHASLVTVLVAAQKHFSEEQLAEKSIAELEDIVALSGADKPAPDYSGIPFPRTLDRSKPDADGVPAAPSLTSAIRTARAN